MLERPANGNANRSPEVCARVAPRAIFVTTLLVASVFATLTGPTFAAVDWTFDPAAEVRFRTTDNVQVASGARDESDSILSATIVLAWTGRTPRSSFRFAYQPSRDFHNDFSGLDTTNHRVRLGWESRASERTSWTARVEGTLLEETRVFAETADLDAVAVPRAERTDIYASLGATVQVARLDSLIFNGSFRTTQYERTTLTGVDLDGDGTGDIAPLTVADSDAIGFEAGWRRQLARNSQFGASYRGTQIDEGFRGETDVHRVEIVWQKGLAERLQFGVRAGAGKRSDDGIGATDGDDTDFVGRLTLTGRVGRRGSFTAGAGRDISGTSGVSGVAVNDSFYGSLSVPTTQWSRLSVFGRYSDRDPVAVGAGETETIAFGAGWDAVVAPQWVVVVGAFKVDQETQTAGDPRNAEYTSYSAGIRWRLRAPARGER